MLDGIGVLLGGVVGSSMPLRSLILLSLPVIAACAGGENTEATTPSPPIRSARIAATPPMPLTPPTPSTPIALPTTPAGDEKLAKVEAAFAKWDAFEITVAAKNHDQLRAQGKQLHDKKIDIESELLTLVSGSTEYAMAGRVRFGDVQYGYALKLSHIPIPNFIAHIPPQPGSQRNEHVSDARKFWGEVIAFAKQHNISNKWSQLALQHFNTVFPDPLTPVPAIRMNPTSAPP